MQIIKALLILLLLCPSIYAQGFNWSEPELVDSINGIIDDFNPSISADGQTMHFTTGNRIMVSHRIGDTWGAPTMLGDNINSGQRQVKATVTPDNRTLYFTSWRAGGYGTYDIWKSEWDDSCECWGEPDVLPEPINTPYMEWDVQLSLDGMSMYFTSDRSFGWGYNDIWCSEWDTLAQSWGEPYNLGNVVNSSSADECPYPTSDPNILYFTSIHHHGFDEWQGGADIFVAFKRNGVWDSLAILPPPINTIHHEKSAAILFDNSELYISSTRLGGPSDDEIYISYLITGIDENNVINNIGNFKFSIYPNPFNSTTSITYENIISSSLSIYDITGRLINRLDIHDDHTGSITWDATDLSGKPISAGVYFIRGDGADGVVSSKMIYLK